MEAPASKKREEITLVSAIIDGRGKRCDGKGNLTTFAKHFQLTKKKTAKTVKTVYHGVNVIVVEF